MDNYKVSVKCPYCGKNSVRKSDDEISMDKIGKGIKFIVDIFTTVNNVSPQVSNLSNMFVSEDEIGDCIGTECYCDSCKHKFFLLKRYDTTHGCSKIECLEEDAPENIRKINIQHNGLFKLTVTSLNTHPFKGAEKGHYADVLMNIGDYFYYDAFKAIKKPPFILRFETNEKRNAYASFLKYLNCSYYFD